MDYNRIDILLNKYWDCETTLEEEQELRAFFSSRQDDARWAKEAALFRYFEESRNNSPLGEFFDHRILEEIGKSEKPAGKVRSLWMNIGKVAAVILVLVSAVYFSVEDFRSEPKISQELGTYEDPKKAFEETKKALLMLSGSMNSGKEQVQKVSIFNEAQETIKDGTDQGDDKEKKESKDNK